jgi:hypothetical protein
MISRHSGVGRQTAGHARHGRHCRRVDCTINARSLSHGKPGADEHNVEVVRPATRTVRRKRLAPFVTTCVTETGTAYAGVSQS